MDLPHLLPALVTPFDEAGEIDVDAHSHNLTHLWRLGVRGFLIAGSTGEGPYLDPGERSRLVGVVREQLGDDPYVACGVAAETVRQSMKMIDEAAEGGADSALVITPTTLTRNRLQYVEGFYQMVADASPIPILLYSVPPVTAFELPEELVVGLSEHPNVVGMKDSGGDPVRMQRLVAGVKEGFLLFTGSTQAVTLTLTAGAHGAITASANYLPKALLELLEVATDDPIKARNLQQCISVVSTRVESLGIPGVKAAAAVAGLDPGVPRLPLTPLDQDQQSALAKVIHNFSCR